MYIYICVCVYKSEKEEGTRGAEFSEARSQPRKSLKYTQVEREEKNTHSLSVIPATTTSTTTLRERASQNAGLLLLKIKRICSVRWRSFLLLLLLSLRAFANTRVYVGVCVCSHFFFLFFFFFSSFFFFFLLLSRLKKPQKKKNKSINNNNNNTFTL